jgi:hypothetical protein
MIVFLIGNNIRSSDLPDQRLPLSTDGCLDFNATTEFKMSDDFVFYKASTSTDWKDNDDSLLIRVLSMSYMWYSGLGCSLTVFLGLLFSLGFHYVDKGERKLIDRRCISPPILKLLEKFCPDHISKWVDIDSHVNICDIKPKE